MSDHVDKAEAWDAARASWQKGFDRGAAEKSSIGDETHAEALRIAERHLTRQGWKFTPVQVAETARQIIAALTIRGGSDHG